MSILTPTPEAIQTAARTIRQGGVVVIPTETVYGIACDALNKDAVMRVFEVKGRPSDNPLIVHISDWDMLEMVAQDIPPLAKKFAEKYWPGPLTLVLPKRPEVPMETTGGLNSVAVRMPRHRVALDVIRQAERPIAAPSANVFMALSPTRAQDIDPEILVEVDVILDGGPCEVGLESTVLDLTDDTPRILRPGAITRADIQAITGRPLGLNPPPDVRKSPGMYRRHYAPNARVVLVDALTEGQIGLSFEEPANPQQIKMPDDPIAYGAVLYTALRRLDKPETDTIFVQEPPDEPQWEAVLDRLRKASASLR
ncbi:MAG: threonylcarbamoyl-AMP synthase [Armatimonadetes bacterium]|nr:threonylcarbamoyl-AMP synthase [Armatimonadota bacterium]